MLADFQLSAIHTNNVISNNITIKKNEREKDAVFCVRLPSCKISYPADVKLS